MSTLLTDWRHRPTHRRVWALAAPMILSNISVPLVALVDSMVIGHLPHAHQLGAVAVGASLYTFLAWAMGFLRMGSTGFAAQAAGRGDGAALRCVEEREVFHCAQVQRLHAHDHARQRAAQDFRVG